MGRNARKSLKILASTSSQAAHEDLALKLRRNIIRVLLTGRSPMDCELMLMAIKCFGQNLKIVGTASSKQDVLSGFTRWNIDVALINAHLEDGRLAGLDVLSELSASYPTVPLIMLFDKAEEGLIVQAFRSGAKGVVFLSEQKLDVLRKCIEAVHNGQVWANSEQLQVLLDALRSEKPVQRVSNGTNLLTERETQLASLVAEGLRNGDIALRLGISEHSVSNYLFRIYNKLGISNRVELVLYVTKPTPHLSQTASQRVEKAPRIGLVGPLPARAKS